ncbi:MAG TPA: hypothetical protein VF815_12245 [Myxococcaceae bacterium]
MGAIWLEQRQGATGHVPEHRFPEQVVDPPHSAPTVIPLGHEERNLWVVIQAVQQQPYVRFFQVEPEPTGHEFTLPFLQGDRDRRKLELLRHIRESRSLNEGAYREPACGFFDQGLVDGDSALRGGERHILRYLCIRRCDQQEPGPWAAHRVDERAMQALLGKHINEAQDLPSSCGQSDSPALRLHFEQVKRITPDDLQKSPRRIDLISTRKGEHPGRDKPIGDDALGTNRSGIDGGIWGDAQRGVDGSLKGHADLLIARDLSARDTNALLVSELDEPWHCEELTLWRRGALISWAPCGAHV